MLNVLDNRRYDPVGHCIYCGAMNDLSNEHIIPYGLSGTTVLPKSTCKECAKITGEQERIFLREYMQQVRVYLGIKSRRKHKNAPSEYLLTIMRGDVQETVMLPLNECPILLHFPVFSPPAFLNPSGYTNGIRMEGIVPVSFGPKPTEVINDLGAASSCDSHDLKPVSFARVIAKMAYALAVAGGALDKIEGDSLVRSAILGKTDDIGCWVGTFTNPIRTLDSQPHHRILLHEDHQPGYEVVISTFTDPIQAFDGQPHHRIRIYGDHQKGLLIGDVQLFSNSYTPRYEVIIGILR